MQHFFNITPLLDIARNAGAIIRSFYDNMGEVQIKADNSPVTQADIAANKYIIENLAKLTPNIPIIAEESTNDPTIAKAERFWLVDPLDGTKSFIKHTGEFTVNIGLIENNLPVIGVVYVPVTDELYYTGGDGRAYMQSKAQKQSTLIATRKVPSDGLIVVASKSHRTQETDDYIAALKVNKFISASSSLKFCLIARGDADIYPRFGPTMEWDTAAADAILRAAGGTVTNIDGTPFMYGKKDFKNPYFIARGRV